MKLVLLVGPPGSGKSTLAKELEAEGYARISQDDQGKEGHLKLFKDALENKKDIVVDRMGFVKIQRDRYSKPAKESGYQTEIIVLHESLETCMTRCLYRDNHPTIKNQEDARKALNTFFTQYQRVEDSEADIVKRVWPSNPKENAIIIDLDGTLCDISHRLHFVQDDRKDWKNFFYNIPYDKSNKWCVDIIEKFQDWNAIVFCSGRPDDHQTETVGWLLKNKIKYDRLLMRGRGDFRRDDVVKELILDFEILTRYKPYFIIDDRAQVVKMWRKRGFTCLACDDGDF